MTTEQEEQSREETIEAGKRALRQQYHEFCRGCAKEILGEAETDHDDLEDAREWIDERIHETADGCYWVIYTHASLDTIMASDNWLEIDDMGELGGESLTDVLTKAAYFAVRADLRKYVEACADEFWQEEDDEEDEEIKAAIEAGLVSLVEEEGD